MSEHKFTPGPWLSWLDHNGAIHVGQSTNLKVASLWHPPVGEGSANARLIAAAPELLTALSDTLELLERHYPIPARNGQIVRARAAISKATHQHA